MSDDEVLEVTTEERLLKNHKRERKELQAKIQSLKHSVPKGDKKKKKEITLEIAKLESELSVKHEIELSELRKFCNEVNNIDQQMKEMPTDGAECLIEEKISKVTRAQKRRERKANKEKEREQQIAQQEIENLTGVRNIEAEKLKQILKERNLTVFEVPSDGNCLYKAIEHQLSLQNISTAVQDLRKQTAEYMLSHVDDFLPFMTSQKTGDVMNIEEFEQYCDDIIFSPAWGGQLEITAISHIYQTPLEVIQADSPILIIGENYKKVPLILSYHRHIYGLGEHYNSTIPENAISNDAEL